MIPSRPYLLRAMHEWIVDNGLTPYILVDAKQDGVQVPAGYVQDDRIVLNISPRAVQGYHQDNEWILFNARFNGQSLPLSVPIKAVLAIYARENGQGMMFDSEEQVMTAALAPASPAAAKRPHLQLVE
ncbi:MAG: ClpXP protease specificity-enhancing factor [Gammaproteobacteria bacterium]|nr:ClpXP protease specificity-enhancing factor [Gammaproteobacteria bacterium]